MTAHERCLFRSTARRLLGKVPQTQDNGTLFRAPCQPPTSDPFKAYPTPNLNFALAEQTASTRLQVAIGSSRRVYSSDCLPGVKSDSITGGVQK